MLLQVRTDYIAMLDEINYFLIMNGQTKEQTERRELTNNFHFIRLLAAVFIIFSHAYALTGLRETDWMWRLTGGNFTFSYIGLSTFFIISGYLITQSAGPLGGLKESVTSMRRLAISFLWKRVLRIFPALIVAVLLSAFVLGPLMSNLPVREYFAHGFGMGGVVDYLKTTSLYFVKYHLPGVFTANPYPGAVNGSIWTLSYEFTLYLLVLVFAIFGILKFRWIALMVWVIFMVKFAFIPQHVEPHLWQAMNLELVSLAKFSLYFLGGMMLFLFKKEIPMKWWLFVGVLAAWIGALWAWEGKFTMVGSYLFLPYILVYLAHLPGRTNNLAKYGDFSYGMYLYAFPVQQSIVYLWSRAFGGVIPVDVMIVLAVVCTFPLAFLSWKLVEEPALRLKR